jgi:CRISPR-associated protein Csd2
MNRQEFVFFFDCKNSLLNGDPDNANGPRIDPQDMHGLVTDGCLKRKIRNYVLLSGGAGRDIFVQMRSPLNSRIAEGCREAGLPDFNKAEGKWDTEKAKKRSQKDIGAIQAVLCKRYYDVRAFGAVMSTGPNAGQVRGPVQFSFSRSVEPILPMELCITRVTDVDKEEGEMGRKNIIPYGLYVCHGFINANLAKETGFSDADLELLWEALKNMFDHDRSAARTEVAAQKLIVFRHSSLLGNAPANKLFELVKVERKPEVKFARKFADYTVSIDKAGLPAGVEVVEML